jgi:hypothetical protein
VLPPVAVGAAGTTLLITSMRVTGLTQVARVVEKMLTPKVVEL